MSEISASGAKLMEDFARETEHKAQPADLVHDFEPEETITFDEDRSTEHDFEPMPEPKLPEDPEDAPPKSLLSVETSASLYVGVFDSLQQMLLKSIYKWKLKRKIGTAEDLERFEELNESVNEGLKQFDELEIPDRAKIRILNRVQKKVEDLPFTDLEYDQLEESLVLIIKELPGYQLPPSYALMMALANVMLPRVLDVITE